MTAQDQLFRPGAKRAALPARDRSLLSEGCTRFGPDADGFEMYVLPEAAAALRDGTRRTAPREAFGLLLGRSFADGAGSYTVVEAVMYAERAQAGPAHVRLSTAEMAAVRRTAERVHPTKDLVGWTHSHAHDSDYSPTDREEQATWPAPYHVGLLTFMDGTRPARAYRGPTARPLIAVGAPLPGRDDPDSVLFVPAPLDQHPSDQGPAGTPHGAGSGAARPGPFALARRVTMAGAVLAASATLAAGALTLQALHRGGLPTVTIRALPPGAQTAPGRPSPYAWSCGPSQGRVPLQVTCTGPVGDGISGWVWDLGDGTAADAPSPRHTYTAPGRYAVRLVLLTPGGSLDAGRWEVWALSHAAPEEESSCRGRTGGPAGIAYEC